MAAPNQVTGYSKAQASLARDFVGTGDIQSAPLSSTVTSAIINLGCISKQTTFQSSGNLAFSYAVSANGQNFSSPVAVAANVLATYNTNNVKVIQVTWTSGTGTVTVLASA